MKRGVFVLLFASLFIASCSEQTFESQENVAEPQCSEEFNAVLNGIASLNDKFDCDEISTRSGIRDFFYQVADFVGGYYGGRLGYDVGLAAGGASGSVGCGVIVGGIATMLGSIAGSVAASWVFDLLWPSDGLCDHDVNIPDCYGDIEYCPYEGSSGSIHNTILFTLNNNGKDYIAEDGNVLVEEAFRDALEYEENLHPDDIVYNSEYINEIESFCKDLYTTIKQAKSQRLTTSQVCDEIYGLLRLKGCTENDVMQLKALGNALLPCAFLDEKAIPAYELEFNSIVESSELDERDKASLTTAGSIYIHSLQYWY